VCIRQSGRADTFQIGPTINHVNVVAAGANANVNVFDVSTNAHVVQGKHAQIITLADAPGFVLTIRGQATVHFNDGVTETANPGEGPAHEANLVGLIEAATHHHFG